MNTLQTTLKDIITNLLIPSISEIKGNLRKTISVETRIEEGLNISALQTIISDIATTENINEKDIFLESYVEEFSGSPYSELLVCFNKEVDTTEKERIKEIKDRVNKYASWKIIHTNMKETEFKRTGFNSGLLKEFDDTSVYDMIKENNIDRLVKYYTLYYTPNHIE
jgi:hypothetical protein